MTTISQPWPQGRVPIKPGERYVLPKSINIAGCELVYDAPGPNATIEYNGPKGSGALFISHGGSGIVNCPLNFALHPDTVAVHSQGAFVGNKPAIVRGGGLIKLTGASGTNILNGWKALDRANFYVVSAWELTLEDTATSYKVRTSKGLILNACGCDNGVKYDHCIRTMGLDLLQVNGGDWLDPDGKGATCRVHHGKKVVLSKANFKGSDAYWGPMMEGDGGADLPPGPKRTAKDAYRLEELLIDGCNFQTVAGIKIGPGILKGIVNGGTYSASSSGSLFHTPHPYMSRPKSVLTFNTPTMKYQGSVPSDKGKVFSDEGGAEFIRVAGGPTFNGNTFNH